MKLRIAGQIALSNAIIVIMLIAVAVGIGIVNSESRRATYDAAEIGVIRAFLEQYRATPIKALYARAYLRISAVSAALGGQYQVTTRADHRDPPTRDPLSCTPHPTRWFLNAF